MKLFYFRFYAKGAKKPDCVQQTLKMCDAVFFPNIHALLRIACTIPVSSNPCERSNSALRRLHHYTRTSMSENRLTNLAIIHTHRDVEIDYEEAIDVFAKRHPRRMELDSIIKD